MSSITARIIAKIGSIAFIAILALMAVPAGAIAATGMAVTPSLIVVDEAVNGGSYSYVIRVQFTGEGDVGLAPSITGDISEWVTFHASGDLDTVIDVYPATGGEWTRASIIINVPEDAPIGKSSGTIIFTTEAVETESGVNVKLQARTNIEVNVVGTPILSGIASEFSVADIEEGQPVRVQFKFENTGNVVATPQADVQVLQGETVLTECSSSEVNVGRGMTQTITISCDEADLTEGDYTARTTVSLGGEVIATTDVDFEVLPLGAITRLGILEAITLDAQPQLGTVAKVQGIFRNIGQIDTRVQFIAEISIDGQLVSIHESKETLVIIGEQAVIPVYLKLEDVGEYSITGYVNYEGKITDTRDLVFDVVDIEATETPPATPVPTPTPPDTSTPDTVSTPTPDTTPEGNSDGVVDGQDSDSDSGIAAWQWILIAILVALIFAAVGAIVFWKRSSN